MGTSVKQRRLLTSNVTILNIKPIDIQKHFYTLDQPCQKDSLSFYLGQSRLHKLLHRNNSIIDFKTVIILALMSKNSCTNFSRASNYPAPPSSDALTH